MRMLTIRKWLLVAWLSYILLPGLALLIATGIGWLIFRTDPTKQTLSLVLITGIAVVVQFSIPVITAWLAGRAVLQPLAALSQASHQIAMGNLDFDLPQTQVRELAEVSTAFVTMGDGLRDALRRQAELEQERRFFISAVAHDLRTPLFSLRGYLEGLEQGIANTPEKAHHYITICQQKADELEHLVADLFAYSQLEYLNQQPNPSALDLGEMLQSVIDGLRPLAEAKAITIATDGPPYLMIQGDRSLLARAVANLLDNAIRHTPEKGTIHLQWSVQGEQAIFAVHDSGPGIAPDALPHLFDPFFRGETSRSRATGGAGLGLAITRRIVQAHGGDLAAANAAEGGAIFTITLKRGHVSDGEEVQGIRNISH
jgi:signal transduction histidine kinase